MVILEVEKLNSDFHKIRVIKIRSSRIIAAATRRGNLTLGVAPLARALFRRTFLFNGIRLMLAKDLSNYACFMAYEKHFSQKWNTRNCLILNSSQNS